MIALMGPNLPHITKLDLHKIFINDYNLILTVPNAEHLFDL